MHQIFIYRFFLIFFLALPARIPPRNLLFTADNSLDPNLSLSLRPALPFPSPRLPSAAEVDDTKGDPLR